MNNWYINQEVNDGYPVNWEIDVDVYIDIEADITATSSLQTDLVNPYTITPNFNITPGLESGLMDPQRLYMFLAAESNFMTVLRNPNISSEFIPYVSHGTVLNNPNIQSNFKAQSELKANLNNPNMRFSEEVGIMPGNRPGLGDQWELVDAEDYDDSIYYEVGDIIKNDGEFYECVTAHTASENTEPGVGEDWQNYWELVEDWQADYHYEEGDLVNYDDETYICVEDHLSELDYEKAVSIGIRGETHLLVFEEMRNPNFNVLINANTNILTPLNVIPAVEVETRPDERDHDFIKFKCKVLEVGQRDTAWLYFEYSTDIEDFTSYSSQPNETDMFEISSPGDYEQQLNTIDAEKDYYYRVIGVTLEGGSTGGIFNQDKGGIIRSFRTDFTVGGGRYENYIDARDLEDPDELLQRGRQRLADKGEIFTLTVDYNQAGPYEFLKDFEVGDWVRVDYTGVYSQYMRIIEAVEEITENGTFVELRFGDKEQDIIDIIRTNRKETDASLRY